MKEINISYDELLWGISWGVVMRILADLPRQVKVDKKKKKNKKLTPQNADDFGRYIKKLNNKIKTKGNG